MRELPIEIVPATSEDRHFILDTWLKSYRHSTWVRGIDSEIYYRQHTDIVEALLKTAKCNVARWTKGRDQMYGWVCGERCPNDTTLVHYLYVKSVFRRNGIGTRLMSSLGHQRGDRIVATHRTWIDDHNAGGFVQGKGIKVEYDPYIAYSEAYLE